MTAAVSSNWQIANQRYLIGQLARVRGDLLRHIGEPPAEPPDEPDEPAEPAALDMLCAIFELTAFERDIVLLCAGVEFEGDFAALCAAGHGDPQRNYPSFGLALAALEGAYWAALSPAAPLRRWQIVHAEPGRALTRAALVLDERILHYLTGVGYLDERLAGLVRPLPAAPVLAPSHRELADQLAGAWSRAAGAGGWPTAQVCGSQPSDRLAVVAAACERLGLAPMLLSAAALPSGPGEVERLLRLWEREAALGNRVLLLDCDALDAGEPARLAAIAQLVETIRAPLIVASRERGGPWQRPLLAFDVRRPAPSERRRLWQAALGEHAARLNGQLDRLAAQFDLDAPAIDGAWSTARWRLDAADAGAPEAALDTLWEVCRAQARPKLDDLAQRIEPAAGWDDLVLPEPQREVLHEIAVHVRHRAQVYGAWGFAGKGARGLGISALFAGSSGTGKTMAAEVLARELRLDLYRIDLSAVVSKYIGETEKNLRRVFDAAEIGGAILLFDEADALFGKRSEVKDSHDRHANVEVSYLLQRMEAYTGLAILTTNMKDALDEAFLRRIRFVVQFPFPDAAQRAAIWRRVFPPALPTAGLEADKLARLGVAGGNIRNIALGAAFLAADAGEPLGMAHLLRAARREYDKLERTLTEAEMRGWVRSED